MNIDNLIYKKLDDGKNTVVNLLFPINNTSSVEVRKFEDNYLIKERQAALDAEPDEDCEICNGTGKRKKPPEVGAGDVKCNGCQGKGTRRPFSSNYPFHIDNLKEFAKFCEQSGGFEIC